jgi:hypothetical protein
MKSKDGLVAIEGESLVIRFSHDQLKQSLARSPVLEDFLPHGVSTVAITDPRTWMKEVFFELVEPFPDGTTRVDRMMEKAFRAALESGADGIHISGGVNAD